MDDQRFDRISRVIASSTSRRGALKGIAAALGGGALVSVFGVRAERAAAQGNVAPGGDCESGEECTTGLCSPGGVCYCEDPARPLIGCGCDPATQGSCGDNTLVCCEGDGGGVCVSGSVGCDPTGCSANPGQICTDDDDCCTGFCADGGVCACEDPSRPWIGCPCDPGSGGGCGGGSEVCCATDGGGVCTSASVGCNPTGGCTSDPGDECATDDDCCTGTCMSGVCACLDPSMPLVGCPCDGANPQSCGGGGVTCCPDNICTHESVGCDPIGCASNPGGACETDEDCCEGSCSDQGVCYCQDPARPQIGCSCTVGDDSSCGDNTLVCCPAVGGGGVCVSGSVGCQIDECNAFAGDACASDADCCEGSCSDSGVCYCLDPAEPLRGCACHTGTQNPCGSDSLLCCSVDDTPGGDGVCTPDRLGCDPTGDCGEKGDHCKHHDDCCGYLHCLDGVCKKPRRHDYKPKPGGGGTTTVTTLPSTGAGSGTQSDDLSPWLGAAALAGAAAIAARKLQPNPARQTSNDE